MQIDWNWRTLFLELPDEDRVAFISLWKLESQADTADGRRLKGAWNYHVKKLAARMRVRPEYLQKKRGHELINYMASHAAGIIRNNDLWLKLFQNFYFNRRTDLMCRFLDALDIPHDARGGVDSSYEGQPDRDAFIHALQVIFDSFPKRQVAHYVRTLLLMDDGDKKSVWFHLSGAWDQVRNELTHTDSSIMEMDETDHAEDQALPVSDLDEFTTLDEIIIHQIVASASGEMGALSHAKLDDMIQELLELNHHRTRNYFHLGFAETLVFDRDLNLKRPELNDERRGWYICGALAGCIRRGDHSRFRQLFNSSKEIISNALGLKNSYLPVAMSNHLMSFLAKEGEHYYSKKMLKKRLAFQRELKDFVEGLKIAENLLHQDAAEQASEYLTMLDKYSAGYDGVQSYYKVRLKRRLAQAKQQLGQFKEAQASLEAALQASDISSPEMLADLALVKAGIRSIREVLLPHKDERRHTLFKALEKGISDLNRAIEISDPFPTNAHYLLAVLNYLNFFRGDDTARKLAEEHARAAISGMTSSPAKSIYQKSGLYGTAQFIEVCTLAYSLDEDAVPKILNKWRCISENAGAFPSMDLAFLLDGLALLDGHAAAEVAESIWNYHGSDSWKVFGKVDDFSSILGQADQKFLEMLGSLVCDEGLPTEVRFDIGLELIKGLRSSASSGALRELAENVLDQLEVIAYANEAIGLRLLEMLKQFEFYDPYWTEEDSLWAQVKISRRYGRDDNCEALLPKLFFFYRDEKPFMAKQVIEQFRAWGIANDTCQKLRQSLPQEEGTEEQAAFHAPIRLVFVGGNEIQEKYDEPVRKWLSKAYPEVEICFEHTGWSSNWGREVKRLVNLINKSDAVIIMQMIRTQLGRTLRRESKCPWIPCTGTGIGSIKGSILEAIRLLSTKNAAKP
ncbi:hypothetical protein D6779_02485 [Candidatus Parcubacteria bacterium]|nr:MAG: hypothetical protein D6779_02485 [Candidatus Parcubacteria bacterium]